MQCKDLEAVLESEGLNPLPTEAREHLAGCTNCQDLLADLSAIVVAAKRVPAEAIPPDRIWVSIRTQLETEGIIRDAQPTFSPSPVPWWHSFAEFFRPRVLGTVGAGLLAVFGGLYLAKHRGKTDVAQNSKTVVTQPEAKQPQTPAVVPTPPEKSSKQEIASDDQRKPSPLPRNATPQPLRHSGELRPSPTENAYLSDSATVLSATEDSLPRRGLTNNAAVDASLRQNLRTLNEFIAECEARLKQNPRDQLTREYLNSAYQQKAELLTAMMDSGRSEH
jgi:hypothetical protein